MQDTNELEKAIIGAFLLDTSNFTKSMEIIGSDDFSCDEMREYYDAIESLIIKGRNVDVLLVGMEMRKKYPRFDLILLYELANNTPSSTNVLDYCYALKEVREKDIKND